jgi:hypothetical protein
VKPVIYLLKSNISDAKQNSKEDSESNPLLVPITYIAAKKGKHLEDSDTTPKSCLDEDNEFKLLTSSCDTSSVKLPHESVRLLQSQIQAERHGLAQLHLEVQSLRKIIENSSAYLVAKRLELEDVSFKQGRTKQLAQLLLEQHQG